MECFNSRARKGRDGGGRGVEAREGVSIHAPARGATRQQSRSLLLRQFQFTRPQGARRSFGRRYLRCPRFNSRARKGRDLLNGFRGRAYASNIPQRDNTDPSAGAAVDVAGGIMPLTTTEFSPGTKAKTTIKHMDDAAKSGTIVLDADKVDSGKTVEVKEAVFADGTTGKVLATHKLEICYV